MAVLSEILALLDRWDEWKRMRAAPDRIDALERRLAELQAPSVGNCEACHKADLVRRGTVFRRGMDRLQKFACPNCGHVEERPV